MSLNQLSEGSVGLDIYVNSIEIKESLTLNDKVAVFDGVLTAGQAVLTDIANTTAASLIGNIYYQKLGTNLVMQGRLSFTSSGVGQTQFVVQISLPSPYNSNSVAEMSCVGGMGALAGNAALVFYSCSMQTVSTVHLKINSATGAAITAGTTYTGSFSLVVSGVIPA